MRCWLKEIREGKCLSQRDVAAIVGITHQHYNYIENGKRDPHQKTAKKIANVLCFEWSLFYSDDEGCKVAEV